MAFSCESVAYGHTSSYVSIGASYANMSINTNF